MQWLKRIFIKFAKFIKFLTLNFKGVLLFIFIIYLIAPDSSKNTQPANLVQINLNGEIMDATHVVEQLDKAREDKKIKGVLFVVNSPGGAVAPSIEISYAIKRLAAVKPVITYAAGSLASGSYYASIYSNKIIANPGSLVGSIGVIMQGYNIQELTNKIGISTQTVKAGEYKEAGTMYRPWTKKERTELTTMVNDTYQTFVDDVATARNLDSNDTNTFANAHIFSAKKALENKLIDEIATLYDAKKQLIALANVKTPYWQQPTVMQAFMSQLKGSFEGVVQSTFKELVLK